MSSDVFLDDDQLTLSARNLVLTDDGAGGKFGVPVHGKILIIDRIRVNGPKLAGGTTFAISGVTTTGNRCMNPMSQVGHAYNDRGMKQHRRKNVRGGHRGCSPVRC